MILRGCQVEEDKDVATALQSNSLCYTAEIDTSCNTTCKSDDDIICKKILEDFTSSNYTSLESNRQSDDPDKCRSHKIESCACTSDFCNKSLVTFDWPNLPYMFCVFTLHSHLNEYEWSQLKIEIWLYWYYLKKYPIHSQTIYEIFKNLFLNM